MKTDKQHRKEIARALLELKHSQGGEYLFEYLNTRIAIVCNEVMNRKEVTEKDTQGNTVKTDFAYRTMEKVERCRGQVLGLQEIIDFIEDEISWLSRNDTQEGE